MEVSKRIFNLETETAFSILARANNLAAKGKDIINLGIGQPDFPTPINIQEAAIKAIKDGYHGANGWMQNKNNPGIINSDSQEVLSISWNDLDEFDEIKICTGYSLNGKAINYLPAGEKEQKQIKPMYEVIKGWKKSIVGVKIANDLPEEAKIYINRIEELVNCPIILISTSPERSDTIYLKDPFNLS